jgi:methionine-rich copper-binding protein CopC
MMNWKKALLVCAACLTLAGGAFAHAFIDHADPKVGSKVKVPPAEVRIWFTEKLEPAFSTLHVLGADGKPVDKGDAHVDQKDPTLLLVTLPPLQPGIYKVVWRVTSLDTHKTEGDFKFQIAP